MTRQNPRIVFCTTCKGRTSHLAQTLPQNILDNVDYDNCKFVVLTYGDQEATDYIKSVHSLNIDCGYLAVYSYLTDGPFHMTHAKNMASRCGIMEGADILVTLDADNYTGPGFASFIAERFKESGNYYLCPDFWMIRNLPHGPSRPQRGFYGRLAIRAQDFIKLGGYNEEFSVWGSEDADLIARLKRLDYKSKYIDTCYLSTIPHNAQVRFKEYPEARKYEDKDYIKKLELRTETVVNYGKIGLGTVFKNFNSPPISIEPVPTRIFGIGLQKTGTTSLHEALQILGYDSFHWGSGEAPLMWQEMNSEGRSKTLELWYALSDNPIPLMYEKLDKNYPCSKFILTIRNEDKWLKSVERWWDPMYNPYRWIWDVHPFSHRIHKVLYGRQTFDANVFLKRYLRHNTEVREYFKDRPEDLLVMDMDAGAGWSELCSFLNVPVPSVEYPKGNKTVEVVPVAKEEFLAGSYPYEEDETLYVATPDQIAVLENHTKRRRHHHHHHFSWFIKLLREFWRWLWSWWR